MAKKMISLEISDSLREALRIKAFKENTSISKVIRHVLTEQLGKELSEVKTETSTTPLTTPKV